jgi:carboxyl-terminal processing protease
MFCNKYEMKMKKLLFLLILIPLVFSSCKKDPVPSEDTITPEDNIVARDTLYFILKDHYLWYNLMPTVTRTDYSDPYTLLEAMRYKAKDRWSYILTKQEYDAQVNGTFVGHGFRIGVDKSGNARIVTVYKNSYLYQNGVRRGWIVSKINGINPAPILQSADAAAYTNLIGESKVDVTNVFVFIKPDGSEVTLTAKKSEFQINTVLWRDTIHLSTGAVAGHLVFESFFPPAPSELNEAFNYFKINNINDLILDLRYNTGGYLDYAQLLASYIAGNSKQGLVFAKLTFNDRHQERNRTINFVPTSFPMDLPRMVVITTRSTASASEDVINGLKPFVNIVTVGETTNGKPTGMDGWKVRNKYYMFPVTFEVKNSVGYGGFYDGFIPDKVMTDDITRDFNDRNELCLNEAINYLQKGSFTSKGSNEFFRSNQFTEKPEQNGTAILRSK